jgi:hypothetical protein
MNLTKSPSLPFTCCSLPFIVSTIHLVGNKETRDKNKSLKQNILRKVLMAGDTHRICMSHQQISQRTGKTNKALDTSEIISVVKALQFIRIKDWQPIKPCRLLKGVHAIL